MKTATDIIEMPFDVFVEFLRFLTLGEIMSLKNYFLGKFNEVNAIIKSLENKLLDAKKENDLKTVQECEDLIRRLVYSEKCLEDKITYLKEVILDRKVLL